jgi:N-acetylneuraminic acid mutarotase
VTFLQDDIQFAEGASVPHFEHTNAAAAAAPDGSIYLIGGIGYVTRERGKRRLDLLNAVEAYDPRSNVYEPRASMIIARQSFSAAFGSDGKLYAFGGFGHKGALEQGDTETEAEFNARGAEMERLARQALDSVEAYDPSANRWVAAPSLPKPLQGGAAASCPDGRIYLVGGTPSFDDTTTLPDTWIFDPSTQRWSEGPPLEVARQGHSLVCTAAGMLIAVGGIHQPIGDRATAKPLDSVEMLDTTALRVSSR